MLLKNYPKIDELLTMWAEDSSSINETNYGYKMSTLSSIHSKYLNIFSYVNLDYKRAEQQLNMLYAKLDRYYSGKPNLGEDCIEPNLVSKVKSERNKMIECDTEYIALKFKIDELEVLKETSHQIFSYIQKPYSYNVNKFFEYIKYTNGC